MWTVEDINLDAGFQEWSVRSARPSGPTRIQRITIHVGGSRNETKAAVTHNTQRYMQQIYICVCWGLAPGEHSLCFRNSSIIQLMDEPWDGTRYVRTSSTIKVFEDASKEQRNPQGSVSGPPIREFAAWPRKSWMSRNLWRFSHQSGEMRHFMGGTDLWTYPCTSPFHIEILIQRRQIMLYFQVLKSVPSHILTLIRDKIFSSLRIRQLATILCGEMGSECFQFR